MPIMTTAETADSAGRRLKRVAIVALPQTFGSTVFGPHDILTLAGVLWQQLCRGTPQPLFDVSLVSADGLPVPLLNGAALPVAGALCDRQDWDLVLVSSADVTQVAHSATPLKQPLRRTLEHGGHVASVCTGAFALAETGLLDGRRATTHWGLAPLFRKRYPKVLLQEQRLVTHDGALFCSGGFNAYQDLCLHLIEYFHGFELAEQTARALLLNGERPSQMPFRRFELLKQHGDPAMLKAQQMMEQHYQRKLGIEELAMHCCLSERQFKRRFKDATGETPGDYLQMLRVEAARQQLRDTQQPVARVAENTGYSDVAYFRDVFRSWTGLTPLAYRQKFHRLTPGLHLADMAH